MSPKALARVPSLCTRDSPMGSQMEVGWPPPCSVIKISSCKTRKPPELRMKACLVHPGYSSNSLRNQRTTSTEKCHPCKALGHTGFLNQKQAPTVGRPTGMSLLPREAWGPSTARGNVNAWLEGRRLPFELMLLKISRWGEMEEALMDVMNQASQGSHREFHQPVT